MSNSVTFVLCYSDGGIETDIVYLEELRGAKLDLLQYDSATNDNFEARNEGEPAVDLVITSTTERVRIILSREKSTYEKAIAVGQQMLFDLICPQIDIDVVWVNKKTNENWFEYARLERTRLTLDIMERAIRE